MAMALLPVSAPAVIVTVLRAVASCTIVAIWCIYFFLQPLKQDAIYMHEQQLDPTEIVLIPYPIQRLCVYVLANVCAAIFIQSSIRTMLQTFFDIVQLSLIFVMILILCGASPYQNIYHTYFASVYFITCTFVQYPSIILIEDDNDDDTDKGNIDHTKTQNGSDKSPTSKIYNSNRNNIVRIPHLFDAIQQQLRGKSVGIVTELYTPSIPPQPSTTNQIIRLHQTIAFGCIVLTILFQILLLYDNGYQIQRYPIPLILGCTIGWIIGTCIGTIRVIRSII